MDCMIETERRLIHTRGIGTLTFDDLRRIRTQLVADPTFDATYDQLIDLRETTSINVTGDQFRELAASTVARGPVRRAIIADSPIQFGLARMFETCCEMNGQIVAVFRSYDEALVWLDNDCPEPRT
jgi:hypothetical protein